MGLAHIVLRGLLLLQMGNTAQTSNDRAQTLAMKTLSSIPWTRSDKKKRFRETGHKYTDSVLLALFAVLVLEAAAGVV